MPLATKRDFATGRCWPATGKHRLAGVARPGRVLHRQATGAGRGACASRPTRSMAPEGEPTVLENGHSLARQNSRHGCAADFASLTWGGAPRKCWGSTLLAWISRDARVLGRRRPFDQLDGFCAPFIEGVQATVLLVLDEPLDPLLAPALLALAPLAQVVIPAALPRACGTARRHCRQR